MWSSVQCPAELASNEILYIYWYNIRTYIYIYIIYAQQMIYICILQLTANRDHTIIIQVPHSLVSCLGLIKYILSYIYWNKGNIWNLRLASESIGGKSVWTSCPAGTVLHYSDRTHTITLGTAHTGAESNTLTLRP